MSKVTVHIQVTDANGKDSDVRVTDFIRWGDSIPERINVTAAEAAAMANTALNLHLRTKRSLHRDRTA